MNKQMKEGYPDSNQITNSQQINATHQMGKAISYSLLFSLGRQYLNTQVKNLEYIQPMIPSRSSEGIPYFLQLKKVDNSITLSLEQQLAAIQAILTACHNPGDDNLIFIVSKDGSKSHVNLGSVSRNTDFVNNLKYFIEGNLPDVHSETYPPEDIKTPLKDFKYATALTGIPSLNLGMYPNHNQIDRLLRISDNTQFMYMIVAEPMTEQKVHDITYTLRELKAYVSFLKQEIAVGSTLTKNISQELKQTNSSSEAIKTDIIKGSSFQLGVDFSKLATSLLSPFFPPVRFLADMMNARTGIEKSTKQTQTATNSNELLSSQAKKFDQNVVETFKQTYIDAQAQNAEILIDQYIKRFERATALHCWNVGVYFLAEKPEIAIRGGQILKGLLSGEKSILEPMRVHNLENVLRRSHSYPSGDIERYGVLDRLALFQQPSLTLINPTKPEQRIDHPLGSAFNGLTTPLSTEELSMLINSQFKFSSKISANCYLNTLRMALFL